MSHQGGGGDDHALSPTVEKGKDILHISAKDMQIAWVDDNRFWNWTDVSKEIPCFGTAADLNQVCWLEAAGTLELAKHEARLSKPQTYEMIYHIKFKDDAFGWNGIPVTFRLVTPEGKKEISVVMESHRKRRSKGWREIYGGEFSLSTETTGTVEFGMYEIESQRWKGGIVLAGVTIRPKASATST
ncbi:unnamed protein product [Musa textilis]